MILHNERLLVKVILSHVHAGEIVAFACSGGIDSMFLTVFASQLLKEAGVQCFAIIVDHKLRESSTSQAHYTQKNLEMHGVKSVILTWEHDTISTAIEEKARKARYELITAHCKSHGVNKVLLAHHIDDKIETFLMHSMRGSGLDGITSMEETHTMNGIMFIRPMLLCMEKNDIIGYMHHHKIPWIEDESNQDTTFSRNGLRAMLNLTKEQKKGILNTIQNLQNIKADLNLQVDQFISQITVRNFVVTLSKEVFSIREEVFFRTLKKILPFVFPLRFPELRQQSVSILYQWLKEEHKKITLANCVFEKTFNSVKVYPEYKKLQISFEEAKTKKNWNNMMEYCCNRNCSVTPLGTIDENIRELYKIKEGFLDIAHLPVFMDGKKILAIPHLGVFPDLEFECTV